MSTSRDDLVSSSENLSSSTSFFAVAEPAIAPTVSPKPFSPASLLLAFPGGASGSSLSFSFFFPSLSLSFFLFPAACAIIAAASISSSSDDTSAPAVQQVKQELHMVRPIWIHSGTETIHHE